jgi:hypothetical protein
VLWIIRSTISFQWLACLWYRPATTKGARDANASRASGMLSFSLTILIVIKLMLTSPNTNHFNTSPPTLHSYQHRLSTHHHVATTNHLYASRVNVITYDVELPARRSWLLGAPLRHRVWYGCDTKVSHWQVIQVGTSPASPIIKGRDAAIIPTFWVPTFDGGSVT